ncbi:hypothetical protein ACFLYE_05135 [Chloroflexota bacterium]
MAIPVYDCLSERGMPGLRPELPDIAGDEAIEAASQALHQLVTRAEELAKAAETAAEAANISSQEASKAAEAAGLRAAKAAGSAEEVAKAAERAAGRAEQVAEAAETAAEVAIKKAEPVVFVKKLLSSWDFIIFVVLVILAAVFGSVAISIGLSSLGP